MRALFECWNEILSALRIGKFQFVSLVVVFFSEIKLPHLFICNGSVLEIRRVAWSYLYGFGQIFNSFLVTALSEIVKGTILIAERARSRFSQDVGA